jgi:hypothetical protein
MDDDADARSSGYTQSVEEADWQHIEDVGLGLASEGTEHDDQAESKDLLSVQLTCWRECLP